MCEVRRVAAAVQGPKHQTCLMQGASDIKDLRSPETRRVPISLLSWHTWGPHPRIKEKKEFEDPGTCANMILDPHMAQRGGCTDSDDLLYSSSTVLEKA